MKIRVYWTNHGFYASREFTDIDEAIAYVKSVYTEASFWFDNTYLGSWTVFGGLTLEKEAENHRVTAA